MATITQQRLRDAFKKAYRSGFHGCLQMEDAVVEELLQEIMQEKETFSVNDNWKIFTIEELRKLSEGTVLEHSLRGKCYVTKKYPHGKIITFENGNISLLLQSKEDPWDKPMRILKRVKI